MLAGSHADVTHHGNIRAGGRVKNRAAGVKKDDQQKCKNDNEVIERSGSGKGTAMAVAEEGKKESTSEKDIAD